MSSRETNELLKNIGEHEQFVLACHIHPDGDTLGSALAMRLLLIGMGKRVQVICAHPVPDMYKPLAGADGIKEDADIEGDYMFIALDCADRQRLGSAAHFLDGAACTASVDHHMGDERFAAINIIEPEASSCSELVEGIFRAACVPMTREAAECLYAGISTDTGRFVYSCTSPDTMRAVARLMETGIDTEYISDYLYNSVPAKKLALTARALSSIRLFEDGKIAFISLRMADLSETGTSSEDCEGIVDYAKNINTAKIAVFLREIPGGVKISLRCKNGWDISGIAMKYGGGGHKQAAGCNINDTLEKAADIMREETARALACRAMPDD